MKLFIPVAVTVFVFLCGVLMGMHIRTLQVPTIQEQYIVPSQRPVVHIQGIRDGNVYGTTAGNVELIIGTTVDSAHSFGDFSVPAGPLLTHQITTVIPTGMHFVASKRGTKLYPVSASRVRTIPPENRLYFATKKQAIAAGFTE
jgi:hypothetical protein